MHRAMSLISHSQDVSFPGLTSSPVGAEKQGQGKVGTGGWLGTSVAYVQLG